MESTPNERTTGGTGDGWTASEGVGQEQGAAVAVIDAVANAAGREATELPPLYETVDPDAIDSLFDHRHQRSVPGECRFAFAYAGYDVVISDGPCVRVRER